MDTTLANAQKTLKTSGLQRFQCDSLTNCAMHVDGSAGHLWIQITSFHHLLLLIIAQWVKTSKAGHLNPEKVSSHHLWIHSSVGQSGAPALRGHKCKPRRSGEFLLKCHSVLTVRIIASLEFNIRFISYVISS